MKVLIVCYDGQNSSVMFKERLEEVAGEGYEFEAVSIDNLKQHKDYDMVATINSLVKTVSRLVPTNKIKILEMLPKRGGSDYEDKVKAWLENGLNK